VGPRTFTLRTMPARLVRTGDVWSDMRGQSLRRPIQRLRRTLSALA
jgi:DNA primase